jgi:hypothetical protein
MIRYEKQLQNETVLITGISREICMLLGFIITGIGGFVL